MIPVLDCTPRDRFPITTIAFIALNSAAMLWLLFLSDNPSRAIEHLGLVPTRALTLAERGGSPLATAVPFLTSIFLHVDVLAHFLPNMLFLWVFGGKVEDRLGHFGLIPFLLTGGLIAGAAHVAAHPTSITPTLGASGSVSAVMGAYLVLHPGSRILSVVLPIVWVQLRIPALVWLGAFFALQLYMGLHSAANTEIAWWAHVGGFVFGSLILLLLGRSGAAPLKGASTRA